MNRLFWGIFLILLDFKVTVGTAVFGLLPDFIGYFLLMKGMEGLAGENRFFDRGRHWAFGMVIVSAILYAADAMNPDAMTKVGFWVLGLAGLAVELVILRQVVSGLGRMANDHKLDLRCERLRAMWAVLAVLEPVCYLLNWVPLVGKVCNIVSAAMGACFLIALYGTKRRCP